MKGTLIAAILLGVAAGPAAALDTPGNESALDVSGWCTAIATAKVRGDGAIAMPGDVMSATCWGAFTTLQQLGAIRPKEAKAGPNLLLACPPDNPTRLQNIRIFLKYVNQHPDSAQKPFAEVAVAALREAFPCTAK
jgi:hypothetical protein